jgi:glycosyltransferase involved in cell wall biosynthesis
VGDFDVCRGWAWVKGTGGQMTAKPIPEGRCRLRPEKQRENQKAGENVTVCLPVRNGAATIEQTLRSIIDQEYRDIDVVVCDNQSNDGTEAIVGKYVSANLTYWSNSRDLTWGEENWNFALSLARGPLVALYHADDIYTRRMISKQVGFLRENRAVSAVFTMTRMVKSNGELLRNGRIRLPRGLRGKTTFDFEELLNSVLRYGSFMVVPTLMTRRSVIDAVGTFDARYRTAADIDLWLRMSKHGPVGIIDEPLHRYRLSHGQGSQAVNRWREGLADFFSVMDAYINSTQNRRIIRKRSLNYYLMERAADRVYAAMNLLLAGKEGKAKRELLESLGTRQATMSVFRPRRLLRFIVGGFFLASTCLGSGRSAARIVRGLYDWRKRKEGVDE